MSPNISPPKSVTAFVLKYRLAHTGEDATQEFTDLLADRQKFDETVGKIIPLTIADGLAAVTYVRKHASEWKISPDPASASSVSPREELSPPESPSATRKTASPRSSLQSTPPLAR